MILFGAVRHVGWLLRHHTQTGSTLAVSGRSPRPASIRISSFPSFDEAEPLPPSGPSAEAVTRGVRSPRPPRA